MPVRQRSRLRCYLFYFVFLKAIQGKSKVGHYCEIIQVGSSPDHSGERLKLLQQPAPVEPSCRVGPPNGHGRRASLTAQRRHAPRRPGPRRPCAGVRRRAACTRSAPRATRTPSRTIPRPCRCCTRAPSLHVSRRCVARRAGGAGWAQGLGRGRVLACMRARTPFSGRRACHVEAAGCPPNWIQPVAYQNGALVAQLRRVPPRAGPGPLRQLPRDLRH